MQTSLELSTPKSSCTFSARKSCDTCVACVLCDCHLASCPTHFHNFKQVLNPLLNHENDEPMGSFRTTKSLQDMKRAVDEGKGLHDEEMEVEHLHSGDEGSEGSNRGPANDDCRIDVQSDELGDENDEHEESSKQTMSTVETADGGDDPDASDNRQSGAIEQNNNSESVVNVGEDPAVHEQEGPKPPSGEDKADGESSTPQNTNDAQSWSVRERSSPNEVTNL